MKLLRRPRIVPVKAIRVHWLLVPLLSTWVAVGFATPRAAGASATVFLNAKLADRPVQPTRFGPDSGQSQFSNYVERIQWTSWGGTQAAGEGHVRLLTDEASTSPVSITLGGVKQCAGQAVYTTYSLELAAGAAQPKYWPDGQTGTFPCHITADAFNPNDPGEHQSAASGSCVLFDGVSGTGKWNPRLPVGSAYAGLCGMHWRTWGRPTVTGTGVTRNGLRQWGVKAQLGAPRWCPGHALSYTTETMTLYGSGETIAGRGNVSLGDLARLRRDVGRPGITKRVYHETLAGCA